MQNNVLKVRTGGKIVAEVTVPVYENVEELMAAEDSARILSMFNKQNAVRIAANERVKHTLTRVGKGRRFEIGFNLLWDILTPEEAKEVIGNMDKLKEVIASEKMQAAIDTYIDENAA